MRRRWLGESVARVGFVLAGLFWGSVSAGAERFLLDFDGTIVHDRGDDAGWITPWRLVRIQARHTALQGDPTAPWQNAEGTSFTSEPLLTLTYNEYRNFLTLLGRDEGQMGSQVPVRLGEEPELGVRPAWFIPGHYRVSADITFANFRPHPDGGDYLREEYRRAKRRETRTSVSWRGRAWPIFARAMENPDSLSLFTARGNNEIEFDDLFESFRRDGWLNSKKKTVGTPRLHRLSSTDAVVWHARSVSERKAAVAAAEAEQLLNGTETPHLELVPDRVGARSGEKALMHLLLVAEDDPAYVRTVGFKMEELSRESRYANAVKFVLFQAGSDADVTESPWPRRWTVYDRGFSRSATEEEVRQWTHLKKGSSCAALLAGSRG